MFKVFGTVTRDGTTWTMYGYKKDGTQTAVRNTAEGTYFAEYHYRDDDLDPAGKFFRFPVEELSAQDTTRYTFKNTDVAVTRETVEVHVGSFEAYTYVLEDDVEG